MRETYEVAAAVARMVRALGVRISAEDPEDLRYLSQIEEAVEHARLLAITGLRDQGATDVRIGQALNMSRQAVQQRWPRPAGSPVGAGARYVRR